MKCAYFQTKWNNGKTCRSADGCQFLHEECKTQDEYDKLFKPWDRKRSQSRDQKKDSGDWRPSHDKKSGNATPNAKPKATQGAAVPAAPSKAKAASPSPIDVSFINPNLVHSWKNVCGMFMGCPGFENGSCGLLHYQEAVARACIERDRIKSRAGSPRPDGKH